MKRRATLALLICLLCQTLTFAQNSNPSTSSLTGAEKNKAITILVARVRAGEVELAAKAARINALNDQIAEMERAGNDLSAAYKAALLELGELQGEVKHLRAAVAELQQNLTEVKAARDVAQAKVKNLRKENTLLKIFVVLRTAADILRLFH